MNKTTNVQSAHDLDVDAAANDCQISFSNGGYLHEWVIYTKNARLHSDAKLTELLGEMQSLDDLWDVVLFSETRRSAEMTILSGGHRLYSSHQQTSCAGVAVLVHVRHCANIQKAFCNCSLVFRHILLGQPFVFDTPFRLLLAWHLGQFAMSAYGTVIRTQIQLI